MTSLFAISKNLKLLLRIFDIIPENRLHFSD